MKEVTLELLNDKMFFDILLGLNIIHCDWHDGRYYISYESSSLDEEGWRNNLQKIRFINPENKFDYAKYGDYFIYNNKLYIITDRIGYKKYDFKKSIKDLFYKNIIDDNKFVIEANFAGFYIGKKDDFGESIYYGDILKIDIDSYSKCINCSFYNGPDNNKIERLKKIGIIGEIYGPVFIGSAWNHCLNPDEKFSLFEQDFGVIPNLCMAKKTEIVANIYYDAKFNSNKFSSSIRKAILTDHSMSCEFWDKYVPKEFIKNNYIENRNKIWEFAIKKYKEKNKKK